MGLLDAVPYTGQDLLIAYGTYALLITEGSGDNLSEEDFAEGYHDYFNLDVFDLKEVLDNFSNIWRLNSIGGGLMLRKSLIRNEFYHKNVKEVIETIFVENGHSDFFDLYSCHIPDYILLMNGEEKLLVKRMGDELFLCPTEVYKEFLQVRDEINALWQ